MPRLCNGMLAYRMLLELIGTDNLFWPVTYPQKIGKIRVIKTENTVVVTYIYLRTKKLRILLESKYLPKVHFHLQICKLFPPAVIQNLQVMKNVSCLNSVCIHSGAGWGAALNNLRYSVTGVYCIRGHSADKEHNFLWITWVSSLVSGDKDISVSVLVKKKV